MRHGAFGAGLRAAVLAVGLAVVGDVSAQEVITDPAALNETASRLDPEDYRYMQPICTRCHTPAFYMHSRTWSEWQDVFGQMVRYGTAATPEQWSHIYRYVQRNLTRIDVNHADEDELSAVLGVDERTAIALVQRRLDRRFRTIAELEAVPGVDKDAIEAMEPRLVFDSPLGDQ
jgi:hypothetical protein